MRATRTVSSPPPGWTTGHPSIHDAQHWDDVKFYQAVRVNPGTARVAARLGDETPLLLDKQLGEGRVLVFASTFDNVSNDFPLHASFVPFIEHTANYLARQEEGARQLPGGILPGIAPGQGTGRGGGSARSQRRSAR